MILTQIIYSKKNDRKSTVVLLLGRKGDKIVCILDDKINEREARIIKKNIQKLAGMPLHNKTMWIKNNAPEAYKNGYRELRVTNVEIKRSYSLLTNEYKLIK